MKLCDCCPEHPVLSRKHSPELGTAYLTQALKYNKPTCQWEGNRHKEMAGAEAARAFYTKAKVLLDYSLTSDAF